VIENILISMATKRQERTSRIKLQSALSESANAYILQIDVQKGRTRSILSCELAINKRLTLVGDV